MKPYFKTKLGRLYQRDCIKVMKTFKSTFFDTIITDPPYGIAFMGKDWDNFSTSKNKALGKQSPANIKSKQFKKRGKPVAGWSEKDKLAKYILERLNEKESY